MQHAINVNTKYDPVSIVDEPRGSVFLLRCPSGFANCHSMTYVLCELWKSCDGSYPSFCESVLPTVNYQRDPLVRMDMQALNLTFKYMTKFVGMLVILFVNYWHELEIIKEKSDKEDERVSSEMAPTGNLQPKAIKRRPKQKLSNQK